MRCIRYACAVLMPRTILMPRTARRSCGMQGPPHACQPLCDAASKCLSMPAVCMLKHCTCVPQLQLVPGTREMKQAEQNADAPRLQGFVYTFNHNSGRGSIRCALKFPINASQPSAVCVRAHQKPCHFPRILASLWRCLTCQPGS